MSNTVSNFLIDYLPKENCLAEKTILVTGAGDGIGRAVSIALAQFGATVILAGRTLAKLEKVYDEIESEGYPQAAIYPINLESALEHEYTSMHDVIEKEFSRLDGLINNAAELGPRTPIKNYSIEQWNKVIQVNLNAPFYLTKALLPLLEKSLSGSIIFTTSSVGIEGKAYWGAYAASQAAGVNLMETLADETDGIGKLRVNTINPGAVQTRMRAASFPAEDPTTLPTTASVIGAYVYLMSQDSINIHGQVISLNQN